MATDIIELRRLAALEPEPLRKAHYAVQLETAERQEEALAKAAAVKAALDKAGEVLKKHNVDGSKPFAENAKLLRKRGGDTWSNPKDLSPDKVDSLLSELEQVYDQLARANGELGEILRQLGDRSATEYIHNSIDSILGGGNMVANYSGNLEALVESIQAWLRENPIEDEEAGEEARVDHPDDLDTGENEDEEKAAKPAGRAALRKGGSQEPLFNGEDDEEQSEAVWEWLAKQTPLDTAGEESGNFIKLYKGPIPDHPELGKAFLESGDSYEGGGNNWYSFRTLSAARQAFREEKKELMGDSGGEDFEEAAKPAGRKALRKAGRFPQRGRFAGGEPQDPEPDGSFRGEDPDDNWPGYDNRGEEAEAAQDEQATDGTESVIEEDLGELAGQIKSESDNLADWLNSGYALDPASMRALARVEVELENMLNVIKEYKSGHSKRAKGPQQGGQAARPAPMPGTNSGTRLSGDVRQAAGAPVKKVEHGAQGSLAETANLISDAETNMENFSQDFEGPLDEEDKRLLGQIGNDLGLISEHIRTVRYTSRLARDAASRRNRPAGGIEDAL